MRKKIKLFKLVPLFHIAIAALIGAAGCGGDDTKSEQTYYGSKKLVIANEQVWLRNNSTNRLSQAYEKFNEKNHDITVLSEYVEEIGSGSINKGKLSFTVNVPENLLEWDDLKVFFNVIVEGEGWDVEITGDAPKGTFIEILTDDEDAYMLMKEGLSGTTSSLSDEWVFFVYVDSNCEISGKSKEDTRVMYTLNPFTIKKKKGWNTVWYKQTYTTSGRSSFSMAVKNPDLKWVLIPTVPTM
jgi:hypothetical protein